jgi:molybdopterin-guanine dinucleotide biosynthesis protein A
VVDAPISDGPTFEGAVLTGGSSRRMGVDKALLDVDGRPLVLHVVDALRAAGARSVVAVGGDAARLASLGIDTVPDLHVGEGPLGGIITALRSLEESVVAVFACDLPGVTTTAIGRIVRGLAGHPDAAVAAPRGQRGPELLFAAWRPTAALPTLERAFDAGERAPRRAVGGLVVAPVEVADRELTDLDDQAALARWRATDRRDPRLP